MFFWRGCFYEKGVVFDSQQFSVEGSASSWEGAFAFYFDLGSGEPFEIGGACQGSIEAWGADFQFGVIGDPFFMVDEEREGFAYFFAVCHGER